MEIISGVGCSIIKHLCEMCNFLGVSSFFTIFVMRLGNNDSRARSLKCLSFNKIFYKPFNHFTIMVTIIATDVRVKIVENWIIDLQNWQEMEVNSFNYDNEPLPTYKFTKEQVKALNLIK